MTASGVREDHFMPKTKPVFLIDTEAHITTTNYLHTWLTAMTSQFELTGHSLLHQATTLAQLTGQEIPTLTGQSCLHEGLQIADVLSQLHVDQETLACAVIYNCVRYAGLTLDDVSEQLSPVIAKLISGVKKMDDIQSIHEPLKRAQSKHAIDNLRKMLLAMIDDVRIVLIKLAQRLVILRSIQLLSTEEKRKEAKITLEIYAPLANRLGIGHLKWELEDLSFRYLEPDTYYNISSLLKSSRHERESYVHKVTDYLQKMTEKLGIEKAEVTGRAKHIYSIYRKMTRKNLPLEEIYDIIAFRILVPSLEDCYSVLGHVHSLWKPIAKEFDDYISKPKPNGYRSIHTAVIGPNDKTIEVQIRTFNMHEEAELGVAAHWIYKEGQPVQTGYEAKIAWLRQLMDWQKEVTQGDTPTETIYSQVFDDCVYVFTPQGDVLELAKGATPLDFAYHIHTSLGHRCRGAKINGQIVPLTHILVTGTCVEILTSKEEHPSRDWLNPHLGYLKTARAKSKVMHWFRQKDLERNLTDGQAVIEKELRKLGLKNYDMAELALKMKYQSANELYVAVGRGDISLSIFLHHLQDILSPAREPAPASISVATVPKTDTLASGVEVLGIGNLLSHIALCCKPIPGDQVIGYITQGQGISIHRQDCSNILHLSEASQKRVIQVAWGSKTGDKYTVDLVVDAYDRHGLIHDITQMLLSEHISIVGLACSTNKTEHTARINLSIEVYGLNPLGKVIAKLGQIPNVLEVKRL